MGIPDFLQYFLNANDYALREIIQISKWKKTYILRVSRKDKLYILKAVSDITPPDIKQKFYTEIRFYSENLNRYIPNLIFADKNLFITEHIEGKTLREYLNENQNVNKVLPSLVLALNRLYSENKREPETAPTFGNAYANIISLAQSGPIQSKEFNFINKVIHRILAHLMRRKLRQVIGKLDLHNLKPGFAHGDFHYNNIFITPEHEAKIIDFENVTYHEYFDFDILYLFVMIEAKLEGKDQDKNELQLLEQLINEQEDFKRVIDLYRVAVTVNPRFSKKSVKAYKKWLLLPKMLWYKNISRDKI